jgi:hypothetical protein
MDDNFKKQSHNIHVVLVIVVDGDIDNFKK